MIPKLKKYENSEEHLVKTGDSVQIQRSDGRIHSAVVLYVNEALQLVTVEWLEGGETKGKDIEFENIFQLNMNLRSQRKELDRGNTRRTSSSSQNTSALVKTKSRLAQSKTSTALSRSRTAEVLSSTRDDIQLEFSSPSHDPPEGPQKYEHSNNPVPKCKEGGDTSVYSKKSDSSGNSIRKHSFTSRKTDGSLVRHNRMSSTVIHVERLQKNREERRLRQAVQRDEKEAILIKHSSNPNWEFQEMVKKYQESLEFKPFTENETIQNHRITVCVRKRPLNKREKVRKEVDVISVPKNDVIIVHEPKNKVDLTKYLDNQQFRFDFAFDDTCSNEIVYKCTAKPLVQTIFEGGLATCFAYGQTGSGKTHTMSGCSSTGEKGIYALLAQDLFESLLSPEHAAKKMFLTCSFFEIYGGKVFDLLGHKEKLRVLEDAKQQVQIVGLTEKVVSRVNDVLSIIDCGNAARTSGQTSANAHSSRSHAVFQMTLRNGNNYKVHGRFHLIDLAGNERGADTSSSNRVTRMEGAEINKSLLVLKECIRALGRKDAHLPFRGSTLTLVLRDSFIGNNAKTCMIAMISPGMSSCEHSLNTLRYADRIKELVFPSDQGPQEVFIDDASNSLDEEGSSCSQEDELDEDKRHSQLSNNELEDLEKLTQFEQVEKSLLDTLGSWRSLNHNWDLREEELYGMAHEEGYNPDYFLSEFEEIIQERENLISVLRNKLSKFREQMNGK